MEKKSLQKNTGNWAIRASLLMITAGILLGLAI